MTALLSLSSRYSNYWHEFPCLVYTMIQWLESSTLHVYICSTIPYSLHFSFVHFLYSSFTLPHTTVLTFWETWLSVLFVIFNIYLFSVLSFSSDEFYYAVQPDLYLVIPLPWIPKLLEIQASIALPRCFISFSNCFYYLETDAGS